jgi:hypothetical protein
MQTNNIKLYSKYKGRKVCFNSRRGAGATIEGVVMQIDDALQVLIITDTEGFPHAIDSVTAVEVK